MKLYDRPEFVVKEIEEIASEVEDRIVRDSIGPAENSAEEIAELVVQCGYWSRAERIAIRTAFRVVQHLSDAPAKGTLI